MNNSFSKAIIGKNKIAIIAEIKKRSPSHGVFNQHTIETLVKAYNQGGANAVSVVTDPKRFDGSMELLKQVRSLTALPIIRKDFIKEANEIDITVAAGANALLLIAHILEKKQLEDLAAYAHAKGLDTVIELHDEDDLKKIVDLPNIPQVIIGINNRNLSTLETNVKHALSLIGKLNPSRTIIAESAFSETKDLMPYLGKVDAFLIGTALLTATDPLKKLQTFLNPTINH